MDRISKFLDKVGEKQALFIKSIIVKILSKNFTNLNVRKIVNKKGYYRVRRSS